jgi:hypothetical protein
MLLPGSLFRVQIFLLGFEKIFIGLGWSDNVNVWAGFGRIFGVQVNFLKKIWKAWNRGLIIRLNFLGRVFFGTVKGKNRFPLAGLSRPFLILIFLENAAQKEEDTIVIFL